MVMTFVHGSKIICLAITIVFITLSVLGAIRLSEKKIELAKNQKEWEIVTKKLQDENKQIVRKIEL